MFPGAVHHLAAQTAVPAQQRGGMGSRMNGEKQLLNVATEKTCPLEDAPKAGHAKGLSYVNRHCEESLCSGHFACVGSSIWSLHWSD